MKQSEELSVLVADDDEEQLEFLCALIHKLRPSWEIVARETTADGVKRSLASTNPVLAVLDVCFADSTSIEIVKDLRESYPVIFVTGESGYAAEAFACEAIDFVLKPIKSERLEQALRRAEAAVSGRANQLEEGSRRTASTVRMYRGHELAWAQVRDVRYFQAHRKYTRVVLPNQEGLLRMGFNMVLGFVDQGMFWRIHRGVLVNTLHLQFAKRDEFGRLHVRVDGRDEKLLVAKPYEHQFRDGFS